MELRFALPGPFVVQSDVTLFAVSSTSLAVPHQTGGER